MRLEHYFSKRKTIIYCIALLALSALGLQGCLKDFPTSANDLGWKPSIAAPIATGTLTLKSLLLNADTLNNYIKEDPSHFLTVVYRRSLLSKDARSTFILPDERENMHPFMMSGGVLTSFNDPNNPPPPPIVFRDTLDLSLPNLGNSQVQNIFAKAGIFNITVGSTFKDSITATVKIPGFILANGDTFTRVVDLNYNAMRPFPLVDASSIILDGAKVNFLAHNKLPYSLTLQLIHQKKNNHMTLPTDSITARFDFNGISFSKIIGTFVGLSIPIPSDSLSFDAFKNTFAGSIRIDSAKVKLFLSNSFGIPILLKFNKFDASVSNLYNGSHTIVFPNPTSSYAIGKNFTINYPDSNHIGNAVPTTIEFNPVNSKIVQVINNIPNKFSFNLGDSVGGAKGFLVDTASIKADMQAELPLDLAIKNLILRDTFSLSLQNDSSNLKLAESGTLRIHSVNGFPFGVNLQLYFYNKTSHKIIDSLVNLPQNLIAAASVDGNGKVNKVNPQTADFVMTQTKLVKLGRADAMITKAIINTTNSATQTVKFYSDYNISFNAGILIKKIDVLNTGKK